MLITRKWDKWKLILLFFCPALAPEAKEVYDRQRKVWCGKDMSGMSPEITEELTGLLLDGEAVLHRMDLMGVAVSTGSACTSGRTTISHVLQAMGMPEEWARGTVRISLGRFNTEEEVRIIAGHLRKIAGEAP